MPKNWQQTFKLIPDDEAAFSCKNDEYAFISYECLDAIELMGVSESIRSYWNLDIFSPAEIESYIGIDAIEYGEIKDCPEKCFYYNVDFGGVPVVITVMMKNGYLHCFYLYYFVGDKIPEQHRQTFYNMMLTAVLP